MVEANLALTTILSNIGKSIEDSSHYQGKISEVLIFNKHLDGAEAIKVTHYLAKKWGLTASVDSDGDGYTDAEEAGKSSPIDSNDLPNSAPTNIALSSTTVDENKNANTVVGTLSGTDPDGKNLTTVF